MDNLYLWIGLGITLIIVATILLSVKTSKKRAREVEELNQHFPENNEQSVTVENMRGRLRRSKRADAIIAAREEEKVAQDAAKEKEETVEDSTADSSELVEETHSEDSTEDADKPGRYRRSIFHPDHLKKDQDETKTE